jgi:2-polyprenyl-6-methoxyphenol hydroxylase-like FAD-dependent oxidoreductase
MTAPSIAVIGAGPCGLTLARLLQCKGINYLVYERDESKDSNRSGGSLDIHAGTGQHALREGGLFDEFKNTRDMMTQYSQLRTSLGKCS